jgi:hypothetical protein
MLARTNVVRAMVAIAMLIVTWVLLGTAVAQRQAVPKPQDKLALGENEVTQLLLLSLDESRIVGIMEDSGVDGYRQERQNLQTRVDEVHGS